MPELLSVCELEWGRAGRRSQKSWSLPAEAREWHRPGMQDPFLGYLFQPGFLTISVIDSQEEGCIKDGCCPSLLVTLDLPFLPLHA